MKASRFVSSHPEHRLLIALVTMRVAVRILHHQESISSELFDQKTWEKGLKGEYTSRMWEASSGHSKGIALDMATRILFGDGGADVDWAALAPAGKTWGHAGLAFCMMSASLCSLEQLLWKPWRGFPYRLWLLCAEPRLEVARVLWDTRPCLLDRFSADFMSKFHSAEEFLAKGYPHLVATGALLRHDIARLECRHAHVRRIARVKAQTYSAEVQRVSAEFFMSQQRILERKFSIAAGGGGGRDGEGGERAAIFDAEPDPDPDTSMRRRRKRRGGGGLQRRIVGQYLRGRKYKTKEEKKRMFREANEEYRRVLAAGGPGLEQVKADGGSGHRVEATRWQGVWASVHEEAEGAACGGPNRIRLDLGLGPNRPHGGRVRGGGGG